MVQSSRQVISGDTSRSCQIADACVIVTSFSTPRPVRSPFVSTMPTAFGEKAVLRIFDPDVLLKQVNQLGFSDVELPLFFNFLSRTTGISFDRASRLGSSGPRNSSPPAAAAV